MADQMKLEVVVVKRRVMFGFQTLQEWKSRISPYTELRIFPDE